MDRKTNSNGCQTFYAEKLDEVCQEFEVPENIKQDVIRALAENQGVDDNMDEITRFEKLQQFNNNTLNRAIELFTCNPNLSR